MLSGVETRRTTPRRARALAGLALVGLGGGTSACAYPGCTEPTLSAEPVVVDDPSAPVTLSVRLADDDGPVAGRKVTFFVLTRGGDATGGRAGQAETDADGVASITREDGINGPALPDETVHGYKAEFSELGTVDGRTHCPTEVEAPITCREGGGEVGTDHIRGVVDVVEPGQVAGAGEHLELGIGEPVGERLRDRGIAVRITVALQQVGR